MDHIEKMAAECMKDLNEDEEEDADDEDLEKDTDLLVCVTVSREFYYVFSFLTGLHSAKMSVNFVKLRS